MVLHTIHVRMNEGMNISKNKYKAEKQLYRTCAVYYSTYTEIAATLQEFFQQNLCQSPPTKRDLRSDWALRPFLGQKSGSYWRILLRSNQFFFSFLLPKKKCTIQKMTKHVSICIYMAIENCWKIGRIHIHPIWVC